MSKRFGVTNISMLSMVLAFAGGLAYTYLRSLPAEIWEGFCIVAVFLLFSIVVVLAITIVSVTIVLLGIGVKRWIVSLL
jgi:hypothetical protein